MISTQSATGSGTVFVICVAARRKEGNHRRNHTTHTGAHHERSKSRGRESNSAHHPCPPLEAKISSESNGTQQPKTAHTFVGSPRTNKPHRRSCAPPHFHTSVFSLGGGLQGSSGGAWWDLHGNYTDAHIGLTSVTRTRMPACRSILPLSRSSLGSKGSQGARALWALQLLQGVRSTPLASSAGPRGARASAAPNSAAQ